MASLENTVMGKCRLRFGKAEYFILADKAVSSCNGINFSSLKGMGQREKLFRQSVKFVWIVVGVVRGCRFLRDLSEFGVGILLTGQNVYFKLNVWFV